MSSAVENIFQNLETNLETLKSFCEQQAALSKWYFKSPTHVKRDFAYDRKRPEKELVSFHLENEGDFPMDVFVAQFSDSKKFDQIMLEVRISALHVIESLDVSKQQIVSALMTAKSA